MCILYRCARIDVIIPFSAKTALANIAASRYFRFYFTRENLNGREERG